MQKFMMTSLDSRPSQLSLEEAFGHILLPQGLHRSHASLVCAQLVTHKAPILAHSLTEHTLSCCLESPVAIQSAVA